MTRNSLTSGHFVAQVFSGTPPTCISPTTVCSRATFTGGISGSLEGVLNRVVPADPPTVLLAEFSGVIHTKDGDLFFKDSGVANSSSSSDGEEVALLEFTGGTGKLSGASGYLQDHGTSTFTLFGSTVLRGDVQGDYVGSLVLP
ncbi:MAG: hypothetical protein ACRD1K_06080 [Acidimicrobiales bacterium]